MGKSLSLVQAKRKLFEDGILGNTKITWQMDERNTELKGEWYHRS
jgi:hypothetical protein